MTGGLGEIWMIIGFLDGVMTQDLVLGDHSSSQVDGERKKRVEKRVGVDLENQDHQKNVNGIETRRGIETVKIERRTRTLRDRDKDRDLEDCFRRPREKGGWKRGPEEESSSWRDSSRCDDRDRDDRRRERDDRRDLRDLRERRDLRDDRDRGPPLRSEQEEASSWRRADDRKDDPTEDWDLPRDVPPPALSRDRENEKVRKRNRPGEQRNCPGEQRKIGSPFVILRMKTDGPQ
ncbi:eukaryotic translation initiation factor 3 subunit A-like protein [Cricetulus griseus]|nr:eukaryotic translation initiation factor 3 subunit A-like protein [Cricetulus griseus]